MKIVKFIIVSLAMSVFFGCNSENEEDLSPEEQRCVDNTATLSGAVSTIINNNCAVPGCHVSGTGRVDWTVKENIIQYASLIRTYTQDGIMPPPQSGRTLSQQQKDDIYCWVQNGAQDN